MYINNFPQLRRQSGEHGPALANYVEWSAIIDWLQSGPAISEDTNVATVSCELVREGRAVRAKLPMPGLPKFACIGRLSNQSRTEALRVAEVAFQAWREAGRPCISPALLTNAFRQFRSIHPKELS